MSLLEEILNKVLLTEAVSINSVTDAIDNHERVIINYHTNGEDNNTGPRVVEVYAYGLTKAGNPVIRGFQPMGDTTSKVPSWKFFRLDRISSWKSTGQKFSRPADFYYKGLGDFNPNGDETMSTVYKIAKFDNDQNVHSQQTSQNQSQEIQNVGPKKKEIPSNDVYKTDTENRMERLRQQLNNPIKLSDLKTQKAFDTKSKAQQKTSSNTTGPKTKEQPNKKTNQKEIEDLRQKLGDTSQPIKFADLNQRLKQEPKKSDVNPQNNDIETPQWKRDVYDRFEPLRKQLENNPRKIDLSKIPKR